MRKAERGSLGAWREQLLSGLAGEVAEVGAGTGVNVPYYPASVSHVTLAEPDAEMRKRLAARLGSRDVRARSIDVVDAPAETLPFANGSLDAVVGTLVLCTVRDPLAVLAEVRRVLRPGGTYVFLEHGPAPEGSARLRLQHLVEPAWSRLAQGCRLTRRADEALAAAGFLIETSRRESMRGAFPILRPTMRGLARVGLGVGLGVGPGVGPGSDASDAS
jgi:ubiquinone/menaquinone biosynthesis C-methylase UbiE